MLHRFQRGREGLWRGPGSLPEASELVVEPGSEPRTVPPLPTTARRTAECKRGRAEPWRKGLHREGPGGKRWQGQNVGRPWGALCQFLGCPPAAVGAWALWTETQAGEMLQPEACVLVGSRGDGCTFTFRTVRLPPGLPLILQLLLQGLLQPPGTASAVPAGGHCQLCRPSSFSVACEACSSLIPASFS